MEAELLEAEAIFRGVGPELSGFISQAPEHVHQRRVAAIGAAMVANRKALLDSERARVKEQTANGIAAADKQRRLNELKRAVLRVAAKRELLIRATEVEGEFLPRELHAELAVFRHDAVERLTR